MEVFYWQLLFIAGIGFVYLFKGEPVARLVCVGCTLWTMSALLQLPLILIQLGSCWGTYFVCRKLSSTWQCFTGEKTHRTEREHESLELRQQVEEFIKNSNISQWERTLIRETLGTTPGKTEFVTGPEEHYNVFKCALKEARVSLCILSDCIGNLLLDPDIQTLIRQAIDRKVNIYLGFGWESSSSGRDISNVARDALSFLKTLQQCSPGSGRGRVKVSRFTNHEKVLVVDDQYVIIGNNNWLLNTKYHNNKRSIKVFSHRYAVEEQQRIQTLTRLHEKYEIYKPV
jgi:hypothetical protein